MTLTVPAEWAPHKAMWLGYPSHPHEWLNDLAPVREEVAALARTLVGPGREQVWLMVRGEEAEAHARRRLGDVPGVRIVPGAFGDIWLRDTGPIFLAGEEGPRAAGFRFNGWGGKYVMEGDETVARQIAEASNMPLDAHDFVLEGGALDHDGKGTVLATRQCLLNPNRNPGWTEERAEAALAVSLGARKVLWLDEGLMNDHTDGHVDNLARFVAPGVVACPVGWGSDDPNTDVYGAAARALADMTDADGAPLKVIRIPSPGRVLDEDGEAMAASHMNFLIANGAVVCPTYDKAAGALAVQALTALFPGREVIGLPSRAILTGGGSFHCITQQEPA
jgi:agmatine deiminase